MLPTIEKLPETPSWSRSGNSVTQCLRLLCISGQPTAITATARASDMVEVTTVNTVVGAQESLLAAVAATTGDATDSRENMASISLLPPVVDQCLHWQNVSRSQLAEGSGQCNLQTQSLEIQQEWS